MGVKDVKPMHVRRRSVMTGPGAAGSQPLGCEGTRAKATNHLNVSYVLFCADSYFTVHSQLNYSFFNVVVLRYEDLLCHKHSRSRILRYIGSLLSVETPPPRGGFV